MHIEVQDALLQSETLALGFNAQLHKLAVLELL